MGIVFWVVFVAYLVTRREGIQRRDFVGAFLVGLLAAWCVARFASCAGYFDV